MSKSISEGAISPSLRSKRQRMFHGSVKMRKLMVVLLVFLAGCATWQKTGGPFAGPGYSLLLPEGWILNGRQPQNLVVTKEGPQLQSIIVEVFVLDIKKDDAKNKKLFKKGMLPQEAAEVVIDVLQSDRSIPQFAVIENAPVRINGREGFRLVYTNKRNNLRYKSVYYGILHGEKFIRISYSAPLRHYFEKDIAVFEEVVRSFKLTETKS